MCYPRSNIETTVPHRRRQSEPRSRPGTEARDDDVTTLTGQCDCLSSAAGKFEFDLNHVRTYGDGLLEARASTCGARECVGSLPVLVAVLQL